MVSRRQAQSAPPPAAEPLWSLAEQAAWRRPPDIRPSQWAERHRVIWRGSRKGPWRNDNAPYLRGIIDIATRQGVVQVNLKKAGRIGGSEAWRTLLGYWAHVDPRPVGMTLPSRDKGRSIIKSDILPLFRRTPVLRDLIGSAARDVLIESINLVNGFSLDLMWAGSPTSTASSTFQCVGNDEVDIFEDWQGDQPDPITATEGRITTYEDRRLQFNCSTPTTTGGKIHRLFDHSTVKLYYHVPCPHCGTMQVLRWSSVKYMDLQCATASLEAAKAALAARRTSYVLAQGEDRQWRQAGAGSPAVFADRKALQEHVQWLTGLVAAFRLAGPDRRSVANVLSTNRERAIWYECGHCHGRIMHHQKNEIVRRGRWTSLDGYVTDFWGKRHQDAEDVDRWPVETKVGFALSSLYCTWVHWGLLVSEWLGAQGDPSAMFFFTTFRLGEAFEFRTKRLGDEFFAAKAARAPLEMGIVPAWAATLLATVDSQPDHFYCVVRAWGAGMKSARVWHQKLVSFSDIDALLMRSWPVEGGEFPEMMIERLLIDSGGTEDKALDLSRTQQVYLYAIPRQPRVIAIKGASRPGLGLYWPMKNPMSQGGKVDVTDLTALMVDTHKANDLLAALIGTGNPPRDGAPVSLTAEAWLLNRLPQDAPGDLVGSFGEYNTHMAAVQRTLDPKSRREVWIPKTPGARHDYRDCEAYQVVAAHVADVHAISPDEDIVAIKREMVKQSAPGQPKPAGESGGGSWADPL